MPAKKKPAKKLPPWLMPQAPAEDEKAEKMPMKKKGKMPMKKGKC